MTFEIGLTLFKSGDYKAAADQFNEVVDLDENNHQAWNALGICLSKQGKYQKAAVSFEKALILDPGNAIYEKNREKNAQKITLKPSISKTQTPVKTKDTNPSSVVSSSYSLEDYIVGAFGLIVLISFLVYGITHPVPTTSVSTPLTEKKIVTPNQLNVQSIKSSNTPISADVDVDYKYQWQGSISSGTSSYSINGMGRKSENVISSLGIISATAQKMDGSQESITLCVNGECQTSSAPYGVVSVVVNLMDVEKTAVEETLSSYEIARINKKVNEEFQKKYPGVKIKYLGICEGDCQF